MLQELVKKYPGIIDMNFNTSKQCALLKFDTPDQAKIAISGKEEQFCFSFYYYRFE